MRKQVQRPGNLTCRKGEKPGLAAAELPCCTRRPPVLMEMPGRDWTAGPTATPHLTPQACCLPYPLTPGTPRVAGAPLDSSLQGWAPCPHTLPLLFPFIIVCPFLSPVRVSTEPFHLCAPPWHRALHLVNATLIPVK